MTATQKLLATVVVLFAVGAGVYFVFVGPLGGSPSGTASSTTMGNATSTSAATSTQKLHLVQPDYTKPIAFSSSVSADIRTQLNKDLATVQADIVKNPLSIKDWVTLGTLHKIGGDYQNAKLYWEYVTSIYSGSSAPFYSLGDLYENYLHDYTKAETNYKAAITADAHNVNAYASLYTMYHFTLHNDTKAAAILVAGLVANPGNNYLLGLQAELASSTPQ